MNRQRLAREWLIGLGALVVGVTVWPVAFRSLFRSQMQLSLFYEALVGGRESLTAWLFAAAPYGLVQLIRSVVWAIKTTKRTE